MKTLSTKGFAHILVLLAVLGIVTALIFVYYNNKSKFVKDGALPLGASPAASILPSPNPSNTPAPTDTSSDGATSSCSSASLGIKVSPTEAWSCKDYEDAYTLEVLSDRLTVRISTLGRDAYCTRPETDPSSPRYDANESPESCVITSYFKNANMHLELYTSLGVHKEIFGWIFDDPYISITLKNPDDKQFTEEDRAKILTLLQSITKI